MAMAIRNFEGYIKDNVSAGFIDPREIEIRAGFNPRSPEDLEAGIEALLPQIVAAGRVLNPIRIGKDGPKAFLVAGETRVRCMLRLIAEAHPKFTDGDGWPGGVVSVPFLYDQEVAVSEEIALLRALSENEGRKLTDFDKGAAYAKLLAFGHDVDWIVSSTGLTKRYINSCLELATAPAEMKKAVSEGKLSRGAAVKAVKKGSSVAREVAEKAIASPTPVRRERAAPKAAVSPGALRHALDALFAECKQQPDAMVYEVHRDTVRAIWQALEVKS